MNFTPSAAGKGDQSRVTNHAAYRESRLWWRSICCNAKVETPTGAAADLRGALDMSPYICTACRFPTTLRP